MVKTHFLRDRVFFYWKKREEKKKKLYKKYSYVLNVWRNESGFNVKLLCDKLKTKIFGKRWSKVDEEVNRIKERKAKGIKEVFSEENSQIV